MELVEANDLQFYIRENSSDEGIIKDNIIRQPVLKHLQILPNSKWIDCGGYIGTFSAVLCQHDARVYAIEADPSHVALYNINMQLNNFQYSIICGAVVSGNFDRIQYLSINDRGNNTYMNVAANSLVRKWKRERKQLPVACVTYEELVASAMKTLGYDGSWNIKFDIEGAEIPILEFGDFRVFDQMYIEYHFETDRSIPRAKAVIERLQKQGFIVKANHKLPDVDIWKWFPAVLVLWCINESK